VHPFDLLFTHAVARLAPVLQSVPLFVIKYNAYVAQVYPDYRERNLTNLVDRNLLALQRGLQDRWLNADFELSRTKKRIQQLLGTDNAWLKTNTN
jgi:hypothetical protein